MLRRLLIIIFFLWCLELEGQEKIRVDDKDYTNYEVEMADQLRKDGKIYVVVTISSLVLLGLLGYTFVLDRKITSLEKRIFESQADQTEQVDKESEH